MMAETSKPTLLVIIGITGDLSRRKLLPAIEQIVKAKTAPEKLQVIGISRRDVTAHDVLAQAQSESFPFLSENLRMYRMDPASSDDYKNLENYLANIEREMGQETQKLFYLSVPPQMSLSIIEHLGASGMAQHDTKLLLEKPFGIDLRSARELIEHTKRYFKEDQIYRIDHYLAKEMAQNLVVFREGNSLFKRTWNNQFIDSITITVSEKIGIEGRVTFYEQTGALRDIVQSHLLQLAALTLMKTPEADDFHDVPRGRLQALRQLSLPSGNVTDFVKRGQYKGYREEVANPASTIETYVDVTLASIDPSWTGIPIRLITGKSLKDKVSEIRVTYKKEHEHESNELIIKLQPNEGVELCLWTKAPGYERRLEKHPLELGFNDQLPEAYEQVLIDAISSNHNLFTSSDEVLETWRILEPIQRAWSISPDDLVLYKQGTEAGF